MAEVNRNSQGSNRNDTSKTMPSRDLDKSQRSTSEQRDFGKKTDGADQQQRNRKGLDDKA